MRTFLRCEGGGRGVDVHAVHSSRDKILLDGDELGGDDSGDEDEVFALKGMPEDSPSEDEYEEDDGMDEDDDIDDAHYAAAAAAAKDKKKAKGKKGKKGNTIYTIVP